MENCETQDAEIFNFEQHEKTAISDYLRVYSFYSDLAESAKRITEESLKSLNIRVHSIEARAKDPFSFGRKASKPSKNDPNKPMYSVPLEQITDQAAIRIITFFPRTIEEIDKMISNEFTVIEHFDKGENLIEEERFGYQSIHYLVTLNKTRAALPEYLKYKTAKIEIQVRTILQHTWAEIEHDIQYKSSATIPKDIKRRFMALAGLLEIADREFQAIQDADKDLTNLATSLISAGELQTIEITPSALKAYLDKHFGSDGRMSEFSYDWTVRLLQQLGFTSLEQIDSCISSFDDDKISKIIDSTRQGQLTRFEYLLLAGMGENFISKHPWVSEDWFIKRNKKILAILEKNKIQLKEYNPENQP